jgi:hypothetical protein
MVMPVTLVAVLLALWTGPSIVDWKLLIWCGAYLVVSMVGLMIATSPDEAFPILQRRLLSVAFLIAVRTVAGTSAGYSSAVRAIAATEVLGVALNVYEWFVPLSFSFSYGRAAGLYVNPNISAGALVAGMVLGVNAVPSRWREAYVMLAGLGVLLTFSRGGMVGWTAAVAILAAIRTLRRVRLMSIFGLCAVGLWGASVQLPWLGNALDELLSNRPELAQRIGVQGSQDLNTESRLLLAGSALQRFAGNPIAGSGLGATTEDWHLSDGTHNVYVTHLAEHGLLGSFLFPGLLWLIYTRARESTSRTTVALVVFLGIWGMFSHNLLDEFQLLVAIGVALAPGRFLERSGARLAGSRISYAWMSRASADARTLPIAP